MPNRLWRALTRNGARTSEDPADARLRSRVYGEPFERVWRMALETARSRPGWTITGTDPVRGAIEAEATTRLWKFTDDVTVTIRLTSDGLTQVDAASRSRVGRADLGTNARRLARFLDALDARVATAGTAAARR